MKREKSLHGSTCIYDTGTTNKSKIPVVLTRLQEKSEDLFTQSMGNTKRSGINQ